MDLSNPPKVFDRRTAAPAAPAKAPPRPVFTFTCAACETMQIRPEPVLPAGWAVEQIGGTEFAYCPPCAIDLPRQLDPEPVQ